jgi:hypothetical protein
VAAVRRIDEEVTASRARGLYSPVPLPGSAAGEDYLWGVWRASHPGRETMAEEGAVWLSDLPPSFVRELLWPLHEGSTAG